MYECEGRCGGCQKTFISALTLSLLLIESSLRGLCIGRRLQWISVLLIPPPHTHTHMQDEHLDYRCVCAPDYSGRFCQIHFPFDINECDPSPCLNGASCIVSQLSEVCSLSGQVSDFISRRSKFLKFWMNKYHENVCNLCIDCVLTLASAGWTGWVHLCVCQRMDRYQLWREHRCLSAQPLHQWSTMHSEKTNVVTFYLRTRF